jgi:hypothetical protein
MPSAAVKPAALVLPMFLERYTQILENSHSLMYKHNKSGCLQIFSMNRNILQQNPTKKC